MKTKYLLPHQFKFIGWVLFIPFLVLGLWQLFTSYEPEWLTVKVPAFFNGEISLGQNTDADTQIIQIVKNNIADEICAVLILVGVLFLLLAREVDEDELVMKLRLESLLWAATVNGLILVISILLFYDFVFFYVMVFNLFLLFILFIAKFQWVLYKFRKEAE